MNAYPHITCDLVDAYLDGELTPEETKAFALHLGLCASCQAHTAAAAAVSSVLPHAFCGGISEDADLRIRQTLRQELGGADNADDILDLEDLARLLKIPMAEAINLLPELPSFEVGGRLRFRRSRIERWIAEQENKMNNSRERSAAREWTNIIQFPGGAR